MLTTFVQSEKKCIFVHQSVAEYHVEFLNGDKDSVIRFQNQYSEIVKDKYVYIAYLFKYSHKQQYAELLKKHL